MKDQPWWFQIWMIRSQDNINFCQQHYNKIFRSETEVSYDEKKIIRTYSGNGMKMTKFITHYNDQFEIVKEEII